MKLPVPKFLATTDSSIKFADGTDENGSLNVVSQIDVKCRFVKGNSVVYEKDGTKVSLQAKMYIFDKLDKFPSEIHGKCIVYDCIYDIVYAQRLTNPDGSVHHIVLGLI